ncbi:MerR family transcriptional regulator [Pelagibacteraceae bacterium]|nr:MerR family transcriptional regulator [Pelagibacteraceae bacterium]MDC0339609.1 MerR family transcriptional regulator [Pelagibacteraceae bacterium]MDC0366251.1 MerR family transcriptional regulator [Pelagibacteraceae bacterium]|tara:strand:+ start:84 stop:464 length:381 start_codon:yes stop_codon:yes gene_type:complete
MGKLTGITQLSKMLNLINQKTKKPSNHILRYWEKKFKEIKPTILRKRRYYSIKQINTIKLIQFLLKDKGMTINGVKKVLKSNINNLDDYNSYSLKAGYYKESFKIQSKKILDKINILKKHGKKNTH